MSSRGNVIAGYIVPGKPHPLLAPKKSPAWGATRGAFDRVREQIAHSGAELLLLYSTQWISIIGHQMQADPEPEWTLVDQDFHDLGDMPYHFRIDSEFAELYARCAEARGLKSRTVAYHGFPIDTGTVVALKLLDPDNRIPAGVVSCNMYADRGETLVLGKAARDAIELSGKKTVAIAVTAFSNRMFVEDIDPTEDRISSLKDDEWNRKILEILDDGRLEDVSQLARQVSAQANGDQRMKAIWWLAALMGQHNRYEGEVLEYQPLWGTGAAVVSLRPSTRAGGDLEFDEDDVEVFGGDRNVLSSASQVETGAPGETAGHRAPTKDRGIIEAAAAPRPVGAFPHARRVGDLLFLSGMGPRTPGSDEIPGGPVHDKSGKPLDYDIEAQTRAVIQNIKTVLEASGSSLSNVLDITCFLIDMDRDFKTFNRVYAEYFGEVGATRTTIAISALPTPIAVEFKVLAAAGTDDS